MLKDDKLSMGGSKEHTSQEDNFGFGLGDFSQASKAKFDLIFENRASIIFEDRASIFFEDRKI